MRRQVLETWRAGGERRYQKIFTGPQFPVPERRGGAIKGGRRQRGRIFGGPRLTSSPPGRRAPSGNIRAKLLSDLPRGGRKMITISHDSPKMWALRRSVDNGGQSWGVRLKFEMSEPRRLDLDVDPQNSFTHETCRAGANENNQKAATHLIFGPPGGLWTTGGTLGV